MNDPTRDEMLALFAALPFTDEIDDFDREEAIYWFASNWHGGQWSNLYAALSASNYKPGTIANGPEPESMSAILYEELEHAFCKDEDRE
jgi:hypothetical protein